MTVQNSDLPPVGLRQNRIPSLQESGRNAMSMVQMRQDRVNRLRKEISENRYKPESRIVAAAIIGSLLGED